MASCAPRRRGRLRIVASRSGAACSLIAPRATATLRAWAGHPDLTLGQLVDFALDRPEGPENQFGTRWLLIEDAPMTRALDAVAKESWGSSCAGRSAPPPAGPCDRTSNPAPESAPSAFAWTRLVSTGCQRIRAMSSSPSLSCPAASSSPADGEELDRSGVARGDPGRSASGTDPSWRPRRVPNAGVGPRRDKRSSARARSRGAERQRWPSRARAGA